VRTTLLGLCLAGSLLLAACGGDDDPTTTPATAAASGGGTRTTTGPTTGSPEGAATVEVATIPELGEHLVDAEGRTLYVFDEDEGTTTACTGGCAAVWPPLVADGTPVAGDGVDEDQLSTATGIEANQVTYHGHLLYYFATDTAPGDIAGTAIPSWFAVSPDGEQIEVTSGSAGSGGY
jgi:predicted lipoprotein with Yx(FWY)xxD motif